MNKTFKIIKREFKTKILTKGFIIGTILGPILILGIVFGPAYFMTLSEEKTQKIAVVDETGNLFDRLTKVFDDTLKNGEPRYILRSIEPSRYQSDPEIYRKAIETDSINILLVLPSGLIGGDTLIYMSKSVTDIEFIRMVRQRINQEVNKIRLIRAGLDPEIIEKSSIRLGIKTIKVTKGKAEEKGLGQEYISAFIFIFILYFTIIFYGNSIMQGVIEEKTSRIVEVLLSSSNSFQLMMGKLLGVGAAGLVQYGAWFLMAGAAFFVAAASMPELLKFVNISLTTFVFFVVFFLIGFFQFSTLYAAVGAMCSNQQDAQSLSTPVTLLVVLPFIISFTVMKDPSSNMATTLSLIPFFTPMLMFLRVTLTTPPILQVTLSIVINLLAIVLFTWVSAKIYRVGILMYGKRPTLPEVIKWMRYK